MKIWKCLLVLVLASCSLPHGPSDMDGTDNPAQPEIQLSFENDSSRSQGIYVNEKGQKFDIASEEGPDGELVRCVEAIDIVVVGQASSAKCASQDQGIKAMVLGRRSDGCPGVWAIHKDDSIHPIEQNESEENTSLLGATKEIDWLLYGFFGWIYHAELFLGPDSGEGYIIVGYAENPGGLDFGRWTVDPGTTVAVYWRLAKNRHGFYRLSRARIIGEPSEEYADRFSRTGSSFPDHSHRHRLFRLLHRLFASFRLFFLNWFDLYLTDVLAGEYDPADDVYRVKGHVDGSGLDAASMGNELPVGTAVIELDGEITITIENGGPIVYERIVIDTYHPTGGFATDTDLILFDQEGTQIDIDQTGAPGRIDYSLGLEGGIYYIKVYSASNNAGPYAVRALSLLSGASLPTPDYTTSTSDDSDYEPDDNAPGNIPTNPVVIYLGNTNWKNRRLNSGSDEDWLRLELPYKKGK